MRWELEVEEHWNGNSVERNSGKGMFSWKVKRTWHIWSECASTVLRNYKGECRDSPQLPYEGHYQTRKFTFEWHIWRKVYNKGGLLHQKCLMYIETYIQYTHAQMATKMEPYEKKCRFMVCVCAHLLSSCVLLYMTSSRSLSHFLLITQGVV